MQPEMKYHELREYREDMQRRAEHHRVVNEMRRAQRRETRFIAIRAVNTMRTTVLASVGRQMINWGTVLQERYGETCQPTEIVSAKY